MVPDIRSGTAHKQLPNRQGLSATLIEIDNCYGGHSERETPGHIPNPEAKTLSADGTARGTLWESRTPPDLIYTKAIPSGMAFVL